MANTTGRKLWNPETMTSSKIVLYEDMKRGNAKGELDLTEGIGVKQLKWSKVKRHVSSRFLDHKLGLNRFRFLLEQAENNSADYQLEEWVKG